jgi:tetratricopeptide (TPR) repeat protein
MSAFPSPRRESPRRPPPLPRWRTLFALGALAASTAFAARAHAQSPAATDASEATASADQTPESLVEQGIALREAGDDVSALALFQRAYAAAPTPRHTAQLALCEQALGRWVDAHTHLAAALAASGDAWIARNRGSLNGAFRSIGEQVGRLEVLGGVTGAVVRLGATEIGALPLDGPVTVLVGRSPLEVLAPGFAPFSTEVSIRAGELTRQSVTLSPRTAPTPEQAARDASATARDASPGEPRTPDDGGSIVTRWWFWTVVGAAVAGGVVATVLLTRDAEIEAPLGGTLGVATALSF